MELRRKTGAKNIAIPLLRLSSEEKEILSSW